jgi:hypothetical protein
LALAGRHDLLDLLAEPSLFPGFAPSWIERPFFVPQHGWRSIRHLHPGIGHAVTVQIHTHGAQRNIIRLDFVPKKRDGDEPVAILMVDKPNG